MKFLLCWILFFYYLNDQIEIDAKSFYTNLTESICITIKPEPEFFLIKDFRVVRNMTVVFFVFFTNTGFNLYIIDKAISNVSVKITTGVVDFCIENTTIDQAGVYSYQQSNNSASATLYIIDKPDQANISSEENGYVNLRRGILQCTAQSNSLPEGLGFSYVWKVNDTIIGNNSKYTFLDNAHSCLSINTTRDEKFNTYTCTATENHGQTSQRSNLMSIDPDRDPIVVLTPNQQVYRLIENTSILLKCTAKDGKPSVYSYKWFRDNAHLHLETQQTLYFEKVNVSHAGHYYCTGKNYIKEIASNKLQLDILYGPIIQDIHPQAKEEGHVVSVICNVLSNPSIQDDNILWSRPNNSEFQEKGRTLKITNLNKSDHGVYICSANVTFKPTNGTDTIQKSSTSFVLNVLYGPKIELSPVYKQIEGKNTILLCNVSSNPRVTEKDVKWSREGHLVSYGSFLNISSVKRNATGLYNCSAEVTLNVSDENTVTRFSSKTVQLDILYGPQVSVEEKFREIENRHSTIPCNVSSNPIPPSEDIHWFQNGVNIQSGSNLILTSVNRSQTGYYNCTVSLILVPTDGQIEQRSASNEVYLDVLYGPEAINYEATTTIEGNPLSITCKTSSNPRAAPSNMVWTKADNSTFHKMGLEYKFDAVDRKDLGLYLCNVSVLLIPSKGPKEARSVVNRVNVTVFYQPEVLNVTTVTVYEGNQTQINCTVDGNPAPEFTWTYVENGSIIKEYNRFNDKLISTSSILFPSARCEDTGTYMCTANNNIRSSTNRTAPVFVNCKPRLSQAGLSNVTIGRNDSLDVTIMFHAVPKPSFTWYFNNSQLAGFNISTIDDNLPFKFGSRLFKPDFGESNIGTYRLQATNAIGAAYETVFIIYRREPYKPLISNLYCNEHLESARVQWKSPGNGGRSQYFTILHKDFGELPFSESEKYNESNNDDEYTKIVSNLRGNTVYIFKIKAENDIGYIESHERNCTVLGSTEHFSVLPIIGSVSGCIASIAVVVVVYLIRRSRRNTNIEKEPIQRKTSNYKDNEDDEGLKDNPLYIQTTECAIENRTEENDHQMENRKNTKRNRKEKTKGGGKHIEMNVYENSEDIVNIQEGPVYGNANDRSTDTYKPKKNNDGLLYADLEFNSSASRFVIRGLENKSIYADIDLTQKATPLPSDSEDDQNDNQWSNDTKK